MALITLLLCTLLLEGSFGNTITPISSVENVKQGDNVTLQCNYTGDVQNLQWYRQYPGQALDYLLMSFETGGGSKANEVEHRISGEVDKDNKHMFLKLIDTEVTEAAVYYCALSPTVTETHPALYKNYLTLKHKLLFTN
ncbi:hypothetical protein AOXY_G25723 [Acipenser oxyrinchus oxyrinchus]|uniref:Ig-like domain-containing protein n=1 Tax=Acipenser oxyrinchus oxyrinchus TaxID=40147 RepID=A0AAD8CS34_ACIOX|nr:hypothetical protein AOXY_G25723 [Acipenser oxyrinchus oxyrinchus]